MTFRADHEVFDETDSIFNDDEKEEETDGDVDTRQFFQFSCYHDLYFVTLQALSSTSCLKSHTETLSVI